MLERLAELLDQSALSRRMRMKAKDVEAVKDTLAARIAGMLDEKAPRTGLHSTPWSPMFHDFTVERSWTPG